MSRLKKGVVISVVSLFGLVGLGAAFGEEEKTNNINPPPLTPPSAVQGIETEPEAPVEPAPEPPPPPPPPVQEPAPEPAPPPQPQANCVPGYSPCIAPGSDVDCAGGSGNGPRYISGPVYVTGSDPYDLDRNGDGVGCE